MIKTLIKFLDWLDKRFPQKVVVTEQDFIILKDDVLLIRSLLVQANVMTGQFDTRLSVQEKTTNAIKDLLAKNGNLMVKTESEKLRDQFIREGFVRETNGK